jgi:hypothetical protein
MTLLLRLNNPFTPGKLQGGSGRDFMQAFAKSANTSRQSPETPMYKGFQNFETSRQTSRDTSRQTSLLSLLQGLMKGVATYKRTFISDRTDTKYYVLA